jgi:hypothetical protein
MRPKNAMKNPIKTRVFFGGTTNGINNDQDTLTQPSNKNAT